jgi:hypothetical protein
LANASQKSQSSCPGSLVSKPLNYRDLALAVHAALQGREQTDLFGAAQERMNP